MEPEIPTAVFKAPRQWFNPRRDEFTLSSHTTFVKDPF